jgi:hypothetical protein
MYLLIILLTNELTFLYFLKRLSLNTINIPLKLSSYGHIAIAFMYVWIKHFLLISEVDEQADVYDIPQEFLRGRRMDGGAGSSLLIDHQAGYSSAFSSKVGICLFKQLFLLHWKG